VRRVFGPRTAVEAVFLVAVPIVALVAGQGPAVIIACAAVGYLLVIVFEMGVWRLGPKRTAAPAATGAVPDTVRVLPAPPAPEEAAAPAPEREPAAAAPEPAVLPAPEPEPEPEPEPPVLAPVPDLPSEPEPEPEPEPAPQPAPAAPRTVVPMPVSSAPRQWNLWDLERLAREVHGQDGARDEERSFLLMYLRDFAGPDGLLPIDFDGLVRDSFGDLVGAR
jgi:hypothetical protein